MKKGIILIGVLVLVVVGIITMNNNGAGQKNGIDGDTISAGDPLDDVTEFYNSWLDAVKSTTTSPIESDLISKDILSDSVRKYITSAEATTMDPVLCQSVTPKRVGAKLSYQLETKAQLLVVARGGEEKSSEMAVVDLEVVDNSWQITNISCSAGETAPVRQFSFEREGYLLKNVPPPLNADNWHLVFEENGQKGHTSPLFFSEGSMCISEDDAESVCDEAQLMEATKVFLQGEMTEAGADVKRMKVLVE